MRHMRPVSSAFAATLPPDPPVAATASKQQSVSPFHFPQIVPATTSDSSFLFLHWPNCLRSAFSSMQITPSSLGFHHRIRLLPPTLPHLHLLQLATIPIQSAITTIAVPNPPLPELSPPPSFISLVQGGGGTGGGLNNCCLAHGFCTRLNQFYTTLHFFFSPRTSAFHFPPALLPSTRYFAFGFFIFFLPSNSTFTTFDQPLVVDPHKAAPSFFTSPTPGPGFTQGDSRFSSLRFTSLLPHSGSRLPPPPPPLLLLRFRRLTPWVLHFLPTIATFSLPPLLLLCLHLRLLSFFLPLPSATSSRLPPPPPPLLLLRFRRLTPWVLHLLPTIATFLLPPPLLLCLHLRLLSFFLPFHDGSTVVGVYRFMMAQRLWESTVS